MEKVNIILKEDIMLPNGYLYKARSVYEDVPKYKDFRNRTCYEPEEGNVIVNNKNVIELGFISSETFKRLKSITSIGQITFEDIEELLNKVEQFEDLINSYSDEVINLKEEINNLNKKCNDLYIFGEF